MEFTGIVPYMVKSIGAIAGSNDPQIKIDPVGFLEMLLDYSPQIQQPEVRDGECRDLRIRYMPRACDSTFDTYTCDADPMGGWKEQVIPSLHLTGASVRIDFSTLCKLQREAMQPEMVGNPAAEGWRILWAVMRTKINDILATMDKYLLAQQNLAWGNNVAYDPVTNDAQTISFSKTQGMTDGIVRLITDAQTNNITATNFPIVGNGAVNNFQIWNQLKSSTDFMGFSRQSLNVYNDIYSTSIWGVNHFGVFEPGTIGLIQISKYGSMVQRDWGDQFYFSFPVQLSSGRTLWFDAMLKRDGCPEPALNLIISKNYQLWNMPNDVYNTCDRMSGYNGSLHYVGVNEDCVKVCSV